MTYTIMTEASGSLVSTSFIKALKFYSHKVIATDSSYSCAAENLADGFYQVPPANHQDSQTCLFNIIQKEKVNFVFPTLDESLIRWVESKDNLSQQDVHIVVSSKETLETCLDKWKTYEFFKAHDIPTPDTSLSPQFDLIKPRQGRGSKGIFYQSTAGTHTFKKETHISQSPIRGLESTIDIVCDINGNPCSIVVRSRDRIIDGKAVKSTVTDRPDLIQFSKIICENLKFFGPVNFQVITDLSGTPYFIEMNPRLAGGAALSIEATGNWTDKFLQHVITGEELKINEPQIGLKMERHYADFFYK